MPTRAFPAPQRWLGGGGGMGQDFNPTPRGGAGMGLGFLDPPHPAKEDDFIPYRLVPPKFTIPVVKHFDFVPVYIPDILELFRPYRDKYQILAD